MIYCNCCAQWRLISLKKSYEDCTLCAKCTESKSSPSHFNLTSFLVHCCSLEELEIGFNGNNWSNTDHERCLFYSAKSGRKDLVATLLKRGINPNVTILGQTALTGASENGEFAIVADLLKHGADGNAADFHGNTPLMFACGNGHYKIAQMLLKHGVRVNMRNKQGSTAFLSACTVGQSKIAKLLLSHGADFRLTNLQRQTPLMLASFYGHEKVVKILLQTKGIDVHARDINQDTALIFAAQRRERGCQSRREICRMLVEAGARASDRNKYNASALCYATAKVEFLFNTGVASLLQSVVCERF